MSDANPLELPQNPIVLTAASQEHTKACRILAIIWEGSTSAGNAAELVHRKGADQVAEELIWPGRATDTNTYLGVNLGPTGIRAKYGFKAAKLDAGRLVVYLREQ